MTSIFKGQPPKTRPKFHPIKTRGPIAYPIASMYGIFTYIYHKNQPNGSKYTIHGWYGYYPYDFPIIPTIPLGTIFSLHFPYLELAPGLLERMRLRSWAVVKLWPVKCSVPRMKMLAPDELQGMNNLEIQCWVLFKVFILNNLGKVLKFEVHFLCTECLRMPTRNGKVWRNILCTQMYRVDCCD